MKTNPQLLTDVREELSWDPRIDDKNISVMTIDSVVTLTGTVPSYADKVAAQRAAERVAGVKAVANDLTVAVPTQSQRSDTDLARAIVDTFAWDIQVPDTNIKSAVTSGWVTLDGAVEWRYQRDAAERAVRNLAGVQGVTNNITIIPKHASANDVGRNIKNALARRAARSAERISVATTNGVVTLTGTVSSFGDRYAAEAAAWSAPGVTAVRDELTVTV